MEANYSVTETAEKPPIYSPAALIGFTLVFSSLAGGVLAYQSLKAVGKLSNAKHALWTSIGYLAFTLLLGYFLPRIPGLSFALGYGWGYWLSQYVKNHIPNEATYPRRSIAKPLIVCLGITLLLIALVYFIVPY